MDSPADRIEFLLRGPRLEIAQLCGDEEMTREQIARALGRASGGISSTDTLVAHGVLETAGVLEGRPGRRAELLRLTKDRRWRDAVRDAGHRSRSGAISNAGNLILVPSAAVYGMANWIRHLNNDLSWGAEVHGETTGLLLCPHPPDSDSKTFEILGKLHQHGIAPIRLRMGRVMEAKSVIAWIESINAKEALGP